MPDLRPQAADLPTHVHKTSCGGDWWQLGTHVAGAPKQLGTFAATPGWEDVFAQRKIDVGNFYASKDNEYPTKTGGTRRINWGWATVSLTRACGLLDGRSTGCVSRIHFFFYFFYAYS